jgi:hypothetical protein
MRSYLYCVFVWVVATVAQRPTVTLLDGVYVGTTTQLPSATALVNKFLGIPFADTPERFLAPKPRNLGSQVRDAISQPPACIQQGKQKPASALWLDKFVSLQTVTETNYKADRKLIRQGI